MRKNGKIYNKIEEKTYISKAHALRGNRTPGGSSFPTRMATTQVTTTPLMRDVETRWAAARRSRYLLPECTAQYETRECLAAPVLRCRVVGEHAQPGRRPPRREACIVVFKVHAGLLRSRALHIPMRGLFWRWSAAPRSILIRWRVSMYPHTYLP